MKSKRVNWGEVPEREEVNHENGKPRNEENKIGKVIMMLETKITGAMREKGKEESIEREVGTGGRLWQVEAGSGGDFRSFQLLNERLEIVARGTNEPLVK